MMPASTTDRTAEAAHRAEQAVALDAAAELRRDLARRDRAAAQLAELHQIRMFIAAAHALVRGGWVQNGWFAHRTERDELRATTGWNAYRTGARWPAPAW